MNLVDRLAWTPGVVDARGVIAARIWNRMPMPQTPTASNPHRYLLAWAVSAFLCIGFVALKDWQNRRDRDARVAPQAQARYQAQVLKLRDLRQEKSQGRYQAHAHETRDQLAEIEQHLALQQALPATGGTRPAATAPPSPASVLSNAVEA